MRSFSSYPIPAFLNLDPKEILRELEAASVNFGFPPTPAQIEAWREEIGLLQKALPGLGGWILFEFMIPRLGRRVDVVVISGSVIFVIEFKIGENRFLESHQDQVWDYALDLKNFHEPSHAVTLVPILVATGATLPGGPTTPRIDPDGVWAPQQATSDSLGSLLVSILNHSEGSPIDGPTWANGRYAPTPTIIEAAIALYTTHTVADISRTDAGAENLTQTGHCLDAIIADSRRRNEKAICFVTGVPGAGKTLVGLDVANRHLEPKSELYSVYLSGNGPLVKVLCEALARDAVERGRGTGQVVRKGRVRAEIEAFIQNVHNFRDDCLQRDGEPPPEHVAIFDEAQRAWDLDQTRLFMSRKKGRPGFTQSEPEFLIHCLDRHKDWATVICLVGGGQEINAGEAGMAEWIASLNRSFPRWKIYASRRLADPEFGGRETLEALRSTNRTQWCDELHLSTAIRSFRSEKVSHLVKQVLDLDPEGARITHEAAPRFEIALTRSLPRAKQWLQEHARGTERYGIVASSKADRLKPDALYVRAPIDPVHWFLEGKRDVRSSMFLEDPATEFQVQGLELDWTCVTWDADLRFNGKIWEHWAFSRDRWKRIAQPERQTYHTNAYRVLLTRARQGMVIVVPPGNPKDPTRNPAYYDPTYEYLREIGFTLV